MAQVAQRLADLCNFEFDVNAIYSTTKCVTLYPHFPEAAAALRLPADHPVQRLALHQVHVHDRRLQAAPPVGGLLDALVPLFL